MVWSGMVLYDTRTGFCEFTRKDLGGMGDEKSGRKWGDNIQGEEI